MKKIEIKKTILENGGITLTADSETFKEEKGFIVSKKGFEFISKDINIIINKMEEYLRLINNTNYLVGAWLDEGLYYLDINTHILEKEEALRVGLENDQLAVYDLENNNSLYLKDYTIQFYTVYKPIYNYYFKGKLLSNYNIINDKIYINNKELNKKNIKKELKDIKILKQFDLTSEVMEFLKITKYNLNMALKNNSVIKKKYLVKCDKMLKSDLIY